MKNLKEMMRKTADVVLILDLIGTLLLCIYFCFTPVTKQTIGITWNFFGYLAAIFLTIYVVPRLTYLLDDISHELVILSTIVVCNTISAIVAFDWILLVCSVAMGFPMVYAIFKRK